MPDTITRNEVKLACHFCDCAKLAFSDTSYSEYYEMGYTDIVLVSDTPTSTQLYFLENETRLVIVFRATQDEQDKKTDINAKFANSVLGHMHEGFAFSFNSVADRVKERVELASHKNKIVYSIGHSLGGALATICKADNVLVDECYTFGAPRVFSYPSARKHNKKWKDSHYRYVIAGDHVTRVPYRWMGFGHTGTLRYFDNDGRLHLSPSLFLDTKEFVEDLATEVFKWEWHKTEDHALDLYKHYILMNGAMA